MLRSCYQGQWRLFAGHPEVLTAGYYYFSPPGTPFLPVPHDLWSRDWVSDELIDPPLGESSGEHRYVKGGFTGPLPSPVIVGSAEALESGSSYPPTSPSGGFVQGLPAGCYLGAAKNTLPSLWLVSSDIGVSPGTPVDVWLDRAGNYTVTSSQPGTGPIASTVPGGFACANCLWNAFLNVGPPYPQVMGDGAIYVVGYLASLPTPPAHVCIGLPNHSPFYAPFVIDPATLGCQSGTAVATAFAPSPYDQLHLWSMRRQGTSVAFEYDGGLVGKVGPVTVSNWRVTIPATTQPVGDPGGPFQLVELRVFAGPVADALHELATGQMLASYGLFP